jgi:glycosyltransferase involved in cell wall biosynthesis
MYCGGCLRDNTLAAALRKQGHQVLMVPLYLPLTLDEADQSADAPIFFGGINVYLEQKSALFRRAPRWLHGLLAGRGLLKWAARRAAATQPAKLGELTLSMLRGEDGNQSRELDLLIAWLKTQPRPDVLCLSNALLLGMVRRLKTELRSPVVCSLQGEDWFLDALPEPHRAACWKTLAERAADADLFVAPSRYFGEQMRARLGLPAEKVKVVYNGIELAGYAEDGGQRTEDRGRRTEWPSTLDPRPPAPSLGFFARMCREKGLDTLVEAFIRLRRRGRVAGLKLRIGGSCGPADKTFVNSLRGRLQAEALLGEVEFRPNLDRAAKLEFLRSLSVFSVPALYGEAFGLYVIEALAAGVPVVQPRTAAFPELVEATGGGVLCAPGDVGALADSLEDLLKNPERARALGEAGRRAVFQNFSAEAMARRFAQNLESVVRKT